ncbi:hypothetical protein D7B52_19060, partial [Salmonella enterica]|nr:hypothetical protein [Salmonella enterica]
NTLTLSLGIILFKKIKSKPTKPILIAPFWMVFKDTLQEQYAIVNNKKLAQFIRRQIPAL